MKSTVITGDELGALAVPEAGQLVTVRDRQWVVSDVSRSTQEADGLAQDGSQHLLSLVSIEDDAMGEELQVIWELEPGRLIYQHGELPTPNPQRLDDPERLEAFLDAIRWGAIASADPRTLQSPFRSGIKIEDYQLDPVVRALRMPRVNLLIADDTGVGKTIEAGLVLQELLLRHRARTCLIVCPAHLTLKWRDEMAEKFGLEFRIVDSELLRHLRRTRGLYANPWTHFPRLITSIDWLKRPRPMRLIRDVEDFNRDFPRRFDLLIVDEAHEVAPSGRGKYATDSQRTKAIRAIAPHFEHRLFLTGTPHNGYAESFSALLELIDNQRFARGVRWSDDQLKRAMVRRLKSELPGFPERQIVPLAVGYSEEERDVYDKLKIYSELRLNAAQSAGTDSAFFAEKFVHTLLKKRLFSSPGAFHDTLAYHLGTITGARDRLPPAPKPSVLRKVADETDSDFATEEEREEATQTALMTAAQATREPTAEQRSFIDDMLAWGARARGRDDSKSQMFLDWLEDVLRPENANGEREWNEERIIIFTEYRTTQLWLQDRLAARGLAGDRLALLYGGMDIDKREHIKKVFQASPDLSPVRILLATDSASEGIDLQRYCHRLVHWEIPWNPNRMEQRNGRIDRHGQPSPEVLIYHFVGAGYEDAEPGSLEGDLEFLRVAVEKVEAIREDLGSVGPVIAEQVEAAMTGARKTLDTSTAEKKAISRRVLKIERDLRAEIARLRERLNESIAELGISPERVERVVRTALEIARQPELIEETLLRPGEEPIRVLRLPPLTGSWARASEGLQHPVKIDTIRPITFDHEVAAEHDDVVLVHLQHRLVQQSLRLLRAEIWATGGRAELARVTARTLPAGVSREPIVAAHGRLVVTGADGHRLHEEVLAAGGHVREGRFARLNVGELEAAMKATGSEQPDPVAIHSLAGSWDHFREALFAALERRVRDRADSLRRTLEDRAEEEVAAITKVLTELKATIEAELREPDAEQLALFSPEEREQLHRDFDSLRHRLETIPEDIATETQAIRQRFADPEPRLFPAAVTLFIPEGWTP